MKPKYRSNVIGDETESPVLREERRLEEGANQ